LAGGALARIKTQHLGTQLLTKRLMNSPEPAAAKAAQIHAFFARWERVLPREVEQLTSL
jgi:hypothetical protein